ncbi:MAG: zinc ribbon domain-containing protein [Bacilli bacterium]|nr:zinc ribbon domain-containing protein [Bacilli bacterium]
MMVFIVLLILVIVCFIFYTKVKEDIKGVLKSLFGTSSLKTISSMMEKQELEAQSTPRTLYGMESVYKSTIKDDFPDLNLNELKSIVEKSIVDALNAIEKKDTEFDSSSDALNSYVISRINDLGSDSVKYDSIKIHKTILNRYEKNSYIATMKFQTALEYVYSRNNGKYKKIQDRFTTEFVYIIDETQVLDSSKSLGLNCPNCGAPITSVGEKYCNYCGTGIKEIVKRVWILNNIRQF